MEEGLLSFKTGKTGKHDETYLLHYHFGIFLRNFNEVKPIISMGNRSIPHKIAKKLIPLENLAKRTDALAGMIPFPGDL